MIVAVATATALLVSLLVVPLPKAPWIARAAQHILVALLIALGLTILPVGLNYTEHVIESARKRGGLRTGSTASWTGK